MAVKVKDSRARGRAVFKRSGRGGVGGPVLDWPAPPHRGLAVSGGQPPDRMSRRRLAAWRRLKRLDQERDSLMREFPELSNSPNRSRRPVSTAAARHRRRQR
jgi:hypothetical protein